MCTVETRRSPKVNFLWLETHKTKKSNNGNISILAKKKLMKSKGKFQHSVETIMKQRRNQLI